VNARTLDEARELKGFISDLSSIFALQSAWNGRSGDFIVRTLGDVLLRLLDLRFVFARVSFASAGVCGDFISVDRRHAIRNEDLAAALQPGLSGAPSPRLECRPPGLQGVSILTLNFGARNLGTLIVGAAREGFPTQLDEHLLQAAANQACLALLENSSLDRPFQVPSKDTASAESQALSQLHRFSTGLIEADDLSAVLEQMLAATIDVQGADFGNVQLYDPDRHGLVIVAQHNFQPSFLEHFALVRTGDCTCGRAAETHRRVIIEDVETDERFAAHRSVAREAGFRAVQSTPLISHRGELLGMLSTHFRMPHKPSDYELRLTDIYVQQAARMLERKRTEEERSKLAAIVQNCSDFISIATLAGRTVFINEAGRRMIGLRDDDALPAEISDYVADADRDRMVSQILPVVEREGFWDGEILFRQFPGGAAIPVLQHIFYIRDTGTGRRLVLATISRDIRERKRAELALTKAQQELAHASRVLSIGELTASLAHEINQPLAAVVANANAARRWLERKVPNCRRARSSLENIVRDGNRASAIIQRLRAFSSKVAPRRARLNVNDVVREVVAIAAHEIEREQVALRTNLAEDLPTVIADRVELQQVVLNLVINSIEALRPVAGRLKSLLITSTRRNKSTVEVSVQDNGTGIDVQHIDQMFDAFFTTKSSGMGLGLAISRRIIEAHNGSLWVTANQEWGLTLAFTLPVPRRRTS
jgi:PAS domain S-box-containing protein